MIHENDLRFMQRALDLARQGTALASPNPQVGAVVVDASGNIVGEGTHLYAGLKHAEILALEQAGEHARRATLYLNLEPCSHQGRTGPCVDVVIAAGISRVVVGMNDPNPLVSGQGLGKLRAAGIEVLTGVMEGEARKLNEAFAKFIRTRTPLVTLKAAMTLDGKIAPGERTSRAVGAERGWITGERARAHVQELRHASDAILVGVDTIIADDPLLTDRTGQPRRRPLLRVVLDSQLRTPLESRVVATTQDDVLVFCASCDADKKSALESRGVRVEQAPALVENHPDLAAVVCRLGELEITSLMIEGGSRINTSALASGIVDKVFLYYAPKILAGSGAVPWISNSALSGLSDAVQISSIELHRFGEDFAVEGYIRDPYA